MIDDLATASPSRTGKSPPVSGWRSHATLHAELQCKPWQYPCVVAPKEDCPYPKSTSGGEWWPTAQAFYCLLAQAG